MSAADAAHLDAGIQAGLRYASQFLVSAADAFELATGEYEHGSLAHAFRSAATELGTVTPGPCSFGGVTVSDPFIDMLAAAAEQHRADELHSRVDDMLVDGRLLLTESAFETLKRQAVVADGGPLDFDGLTFVPNAAVPPWALLSVLVIPDDGQLHDVGNGKVAIVSPLDHKTILVMPADLADPPAPRPLRLDDRYPLI